MLPSAIRARSCLGTKSSLQTSFYAVGPPVRLATVQVS
jgi:hypothetical protein